MIKQYGKAGILAHSNLAQTLNSINNYAYKGGSIVVISSEANRVIDIGRRLVEIVLHEDGRFYKANDEKRTMPITVAPIRMDVINLRQSCTGDWRYRPTTEEELNFELGERVLQLANEEEIARGQIGVRCQGTSSDRYVAEFYRIR